MMKMIRLQNFKSLVDVTLDLGRVNVFIGENGCGKTNVLEGVAFAAGTLDDDLSDSSLFNHGVRVPEPTLLTSAFAADPANASAAEGASRVLTTVHAEGAGAAVELATVYSTEKTRWMEEGVFAARQGVVLPEEVARLFAKSQVRRSTAKQLLKFLIYAPEHSTLRRFVEEGQVKPLGVKGEGLFQLLTRLSQDKDRWADITGSLEVLEWFGSLNIGSNLGPFETRLDIKDRFLAPGAPSLSQLSTNEGFFYLLFLYAALVSDKTPPFFAVDNVDTSLNPRLCTEVMRRCVELAKKHNKQVMFTTHNPGLLDGLNLHDEEQRLFSVSRNSEGHTRVRRVLAPKPLGDEAPVKLSEAFMRGALGGLPKNF